MTKPLYIEILDDGIPDVTYLIGTGRISDAQIAALRRYNDTFQVACYWPCVENFRACVTAYDDLLAQESQGANEVAA